MNRIVAAVLLLGFTSASHGITGNDLQQQCQQDTLLCTGYVRGVFDAHTSWKNTIDVSRKTYPPTQAEQDDAVLRSSQPNYCVPANSTLSQLKQIIVKYLREHPETLHVHAERLINDALNTAFPCE